MEDAIDKKNLRDRISRSIIKRQFVNYISPEEMERRRREEELLSGGTENGAESAEHKSRRQQDLENGYNPLTGSYSGHYGEKSDVDLTKSQIEKILGEKDEAIRQMMQEHGQD